MLSPRDEDTPRVWVLHDGKAGMISQALGLAEATGFSFEERDIAPRGPWRVMPPALRPFPLKGMVEPWPDLVIGCGGNAAPPALAVRRASGHRTIAVHIQDPRTHRAEFDLLVLPQHDRLRAANVLLTRGAVHRVTREKLEAARLRFPGLASLPRPVTAVLIGGSNKAYRLTDDALAALGRSLAEAAGGGSLVVTPSRRTGANGQRILRESLARVRAEIWDGTGENPYLAYLAVADAIVATADSVSMVSEAAATGKPVHVASLPGGNAKFERFHRAMAEAGITRPFAGRIESWHYAVPDDTSRAGAAVRDLVLQRRAKRAA